ncbi:hypothetical protein [Phenylobacterium sp.]|jgi:hypothetical protein|uniref:hypothetical protein n=1 Tax=Phenylobacterium sp. TaxID=1871053 RepID=UPI002F3E5CB1
MAGNVGGVIRGAFHTAEGLASGAMFLGRITNPYDRLMSAPGQSAGDQVLGAGKSVADYTKRALANPQIVVDDVRNGAHQLRVDLDSAATPTGQTVREEVDHRLGIGANQGELAWNVGSLAIGGPEINALTGSVPRRS